MAYQVYDLFPHSAIIKEEDGSFTVRTYAPDAEWLYSMLLQYGATSVSSARLRCVKDCSAACGRLFSLYEPGHI